MAHIPLGWGGGEESAYLNSQTRYFELPIQKSKSVSTKPPKSDQSGDFS
jgi:hypothetical protein